MLQELQEGFEVFIICLLYSILFVKGYRFFSYLRTNNYFLENERDRGGESEGGFYYEDGSIFRQYDEDDWNV